MSGAILSLNAGSSSFKCAVHVRGELLFRGEVTELASTPSVRLKNAAGDLTFEHAFPAATLDVVLEALLGFLESRTALAGVGHRVVHGGARFADPLRLDAAVVAELEKLIPLAPLHQPAALAPIRALQQLRPALPQVACFDTAFHRTLPREAATYALPLELADAGLRRYGFHGLSYEFIAGTLRERWPTLAAGRVIVAHLGGGSSLCAMRDGRSEDTTMGFTPLDGVPMQTRSGAVDPGLLVYLLRSRSMTPDALEELLEKRSGLRGLSGASGDMRELEASSDPRAELALAVFAHRIRGAMGGLAANLGGVDGLVFTGGIGAHSAAARRRICDGLGFLGVSLDVASNQGDGARISTGEVCVLKLATDEERVIAGHTVRVLGVPE